MFRPTPQFLPPEKENKTKKTINAHVREGARYPWQTNNTRNFDFFLFFFCFNLSQCHCFFSNAGKTSHVSRTVSPPPKKKRKACYHHPLFLSISTSLSLSFFCWCCEICCFLLGVAFVFRILSSAKENILFRFYFSCSKKKNAKLMRIEHDACKMACLFKSPVALTG